MFKRAKRQENKAYCRATTVLETILEMPRWKNFYFHFLSSRFTDRHNFSGIFQDSTHQYYSPIGQFYVIFSKKLGKVVIDHVPTFRQPNFFRWRNNSDNEMKSA